MTGLRPPPGKAAANQLTSRPDMAINKYYSIAL